MFKKITLTCILTITCIGLNAQNYSIDYIKASPTAAKKIAKEQQKKSFWYMSATWCGICRQLDNEVLNRKEVTEYINSNFISKKIDANTPQGKEIVKMYGVRAFPTFLIFDKNGTLIGAIEGGDTPNQFIKNLELIK